MFGVTTEHNASHGRFAHVAEPGDTVEAAHGDNLELLRRLGNPAAPHRAEG